MSTIARRLMRICGVYGAMERKLAKTYLAISIDCLTGFLFHCASNSYGVSRATLYKRIAAG
jgi:hypothetical protein